MESVVPFFHRAAHSVWRAICWVVYTAVSAICWIFQCLVAPFRRSTASAQVPVIRGRTKAQMREQAQKLLGVDSVKQYNCAFCGATGVGKSSIINAIRGLKDTDADAAPVGVSDTTENITNYVFSKYPNVALWDIPGWGTQSQTAEEYFLDKRLYAFDHLLIMTGNRVMEMDIKMAKYSVGHNVPVSFLRSKSDIDLMNESENGGCEISKVKEDYRQRILEYTLNELPEGLKDHPFYLVSAKVFRMKKYAECKLDEDELWKWVVNVAPES